MRSLIATLRSSDPGLMVLFGSLGVAALVCWAFMGQTDPVPAGKTVITICRPGYKRDREEMRELREAFARLRPDIHVKVIQSNLERKQDTMIAAGVAPDVIFVAVDRADYYVDGHSLLDLGPFVARDPEMSALLFGGPEGRPPDFSERNLAPFMRNEDGRQALYALPVTYVPFVFFYNKDLFDRYRVPYPDESWDWEGLRQRAIALTRDHQGRRADQPGFDPRRVECYGFQYAFWQHPVETFIRQAGGRLVSEDGLRVVADDPHTIEALQFLYDLKERDHAVPAFVPSGARTERQVSFQRGTVAMYLGGVFSIPTLREQAPHLDWDIAPLPRGPRGKRASVVFTNGWGVSRESRHPEAAYAFLRFLVSDEALRIIGRRQVFLPCRRSILREVVTRDETRPPRSVWALTHDVDHGYAYAPSSTTQYYFDVYECINEHFEKLLQIPNPPFDPATAGRLMTEEGNRILHRDRRPRADTSFGYFVLALAVAPAAVLLYRLLRRRRPLSRIAVQEERWGYALITPWIVGFLLFMAFPILVSIGLSFAQWQSLSDFTRAEFLGLENYRVALAGDDPKFWPSLWVTFRYALLAVPAGLVAGLALAILMNQAVRGITLYRTLFYLPAVLPSVATAVLWWYLFDAHHGWINRVVEWINIGGWVEALTAALNLPYPIGWLVDPRVVPIVFVVMSLWIVGGGMIIYLAGLQGIPTALYEAAEIDGAGRWRRFQYVTLPMLSPVILFNLIMGIIGSFQVFNVAFVLYDGAPGPGDSALFYGLHLFREAFFKYRLGYASALAWILFVLILAMTAMVFKSSPMWVHYEAQRRKRT